MVSKKKVEELSVTNEAGPAPAAEESLELEMVSPGYGAAQVKVFLLRAKAALPTRATSGSACFDLAYTPPSKGAREEVTIQPGRTVILETGLAMAIPEGFEGQVRSRSGMATVGVVVLNAPGTVDSDYRGEVHVILHNLGRAPYTVKPGDRIAQMRFGWVPNVNLVEASSFAEVCEGGVDRGGGFGSTGK